MSAKKVTKKERKTLVEEEKKKEKLRKYAEGNLTRQEGYDMAKSAANEAVSKFAEMINDPVRINMTEMLALSNLLKRKGVITDEEMDEEVEKVIAELSKLEEPKEDKEKEKE